MAPNANQIIVVHHGGPAEQLAQQRMAGARGRSPRGCIRRSGRWQRRARTAGTGAAAWRCGTRCFDSSRSDADGSASGHAPHARRETLRSRASASSCSMLPPSLSSANGAVCEASACARDTSQFVSQPVALPYMAAELAGTWERIVLKAPLHTFHRTRQSTVKECASHRSVTDTTNCTSCRCQCKCQVGPQRGCAAWPSGAQHLWS